MICIHRCLRCTIKKSPSRLSLKSRFSTICPFSAKVTLLLVNLLTAPGKIVSYTFRRRESRAIDLYGSAAAAAAARCDSDSIIRVIQDSADSASSVRPWFNRSKRSMRSSVSYEAAKRRSTYRRKVAFSSEGEIIKISKAR